MYRNEELKQCQDLITSIEAGKDGDAKDKKLLDLAKKQKSYLTKIDSLETQYFMNLRKGWRKMGKTWHN